MIAYLVDTQFRVVQQGDAVTTQSQVIGQLAADIRPGSHERSYQLVERNSQRLGLFQSFSVLRVTAEVGDERLQISRGQH